MNNIVFHIGYHKTGTSWLQKIYFPKHPNIHLISNSQKPWDDPFLSYLIGSPDRKFDYRHCRNLLRKQISNCACEENDVYLISSERLSGHPFSGGYDNFRIAERLRMCVEDAKILCVIRNQIDMIRSVYKQLISEGYTGDITSFLHTKSWDTASFDLSFYEYDLLIKKYQNLFGTKNVYTVCYEKMVYDIGRFLSDICQFINIPNFQISDELLKKMINKKSGLSKVLKFTRFLNYFTKTELNPFPLIPLFTINNYKLRSRIIYWSGKFLKQNDILDIEIIDEIKKCYKKSNLKLKEIDNFDLGCFFENYIA